VPVSVSSSRLELAMHRHFSLFGLIATLVLLPYSAGHAQNSLNQTAHVYVAQGSTTFTHRVMEPYRAAIEESSGCKLTVLSSKSSRGLLALFEKQADFAMISGPLEHEIGDLKSNYPDLRYDRLQAFSVTNTRMAFAINRDNPVRKITDNNMRRILLGQITNWHDVGGKDLPIKIVMVQEGGGVVDSIENEFLAGKKINSPNPLLVQNSSLVIKTTEAMPEALGLSQLEIVRKSDAIELQLEHPIEQHLALVTLGDPDSEMRKIIEAARNIMGSTD
jgi:ABC-type phosphate transport system substrate-binding protein